VARPILADRAAALGAYALELAGRSTSRIAEPVQALDDFLAHRPRPGAATPAEAAAAAVRHCLTLARFVRTRGGLGPGDWRQVPVESAAQAVRQRHAHGLDTELAVDLFDELIEEDVTGPDTVEAFVCATAQLLIEVDPHEPGELLAVRTAELLGAVPPKARWLLAACLREAPEHDPAATDLRPYLGADAPDRAQVDRMATKAGRRGVLSAGLQAVEALSAVVGDSLGIPREELLALVLPGALVEHELLRLPSA
jgi:hypothetical protein